LRNDSRRGPVFRRVRRQAQEILLEIKAGTLCHARRREASNIDWKRRRKPSPNPWSTADFSRARIEEHYEDSHSKMWGKLKTKSGRCGRHVRSGCLAGLQREQIGGALTPRHRWKYQDYNKQCRGEADFVTVRSFHFNGISNGYTPLVPQQPESAS
jgi:hypothetical protein